MICGLTVAVAVGRLGCIGSACVIGFELRGGTAVGKQQVVLVHYQHMANTLLASNYSGSRGEY